MGLLEDEGLLQRSPDKFATVSVTADGRDFLRRREPLSLSRIRRDAQDLAEQANLQQGARGQGKGRADFDPQLCTSVFASCGSAWQKPGNTRHT